MLTPPRIADNVAQVRERFNVTGSADVWDDPPPA